MYTTFIDFIIYSQARNIIYTIIGIVKPRITDYIVVLKYNDYGFRY